MSEGLMCLKCRKYLGNEESHCACPEPEPSWDGKTPAPRTTTTEREELARVLAGVEQSETFYHDAADATLAWLAGRLPSVPQQQLPEGIGSAVSDEEVRQFERVEFERLSWNDPYATAKAMENFIRNRLRRLSEGAPAQPEEGK